jgi:hypothetical protein
MGCKMCKSLTLEVFYNFEELVLYLFSRNSLREKSCSALVFNDFFHCVISSMDLDDKQEVGVQEMLALFTLHPLVKTGIGEEIKMADS